MRFKIRIHRCRLSSSLAVHFTPRKSLKHSKRIKHELK